jgi:hypothetical protein
VNGYHTPLIDRVSLKLAFVTRVGDLGCGSDYYKWIAAVPISPAAFVVSPRLAARLARAQAPYLIELTNLWWRRQENMEKQNCCSPYKNAVA